MTEHLETPDTTQLDVAAQPAATDLVRQLESVAARLDGADQLDSMPLTDVAEQLAVLHGQLQSALSELDRT